MLRLFVDTCVWLDLAKKRDGQKWIVPIRLLVHDGGLELLAPQLVLDEFERNRQRVQSTMTASVTDRFRQLRRDLGEYGPEGHAEPLHWLDDLAHRVPLISAMATQNFKFIAELLDQARRLEPTDAERAAVVQRGIDKRVPF